MNRSTPGLPAATAKSLQLCTTLCDPIDGSPPGSAVSGIRQARTLEWVAISFSNAWKWKVKVKSLGHVRLLATPRTAAYQAPASMGFSRQEYWSGVPLPSPHLCYYFHYYLANRNTIISFLETPSSPFYRVVLPNFHKTDTKGLITEMDKSIQLILQS